MLKRAECVQNAHPVMVQKSWKMAFQIPRNR